jgi:hypothetical protein
MSGSKPTKADLVAFLSPERLAATTVPVLETMCAILRRSDKPQPRRAHRPRVQFDEPPAAEREKTGGEKREGDEKRYAREERRR